MERAHQLSAAWKNKERKQLIEARHQMHFSQQEVAEKVGVSKVTIHRWEREGDIPQPLHRRELCILFGKTAQELGFPQEERASQETPVDVQTVNGVESIAAEDEVVTTFRQHHLLLRLMRIVWNSPWNDARYQQLQSLVTLELEDNSMHDDISRRDALRFLALFPAEMFGLSQFQAGFKRGVSHEDILKHCAAGIVACWQLRKGKELAFADAAVSKYIPTLKALVHVAPTTQRTAAVDLLVQCFLLKAALAWTMAPARGAVINYAQEAESYCAASENRLLYITTLRLKAAALWHINQWEKALQAAEKAESLLEERDKQDKQKQKSASSSPAEEPIPQLVYSHVYTGLANCQAHFKRKNEATSSLKKAHAAFFSQSSDETISIWVDHSIGNLLVTDSETHMHLGSYKEAVDALELIETRYADNPGIAFSFRVEAAFDQAMAEAIRDDQPRDMQRCIALWKKGLEGAKTLKSEKRFDEAIQVHKTMLAAWPKEQCIKDLIENIDL